MSGKSLCCWFAVLVALVALSACGERPRHAQTDAERQRAMTLIQRHGCGGCHSIAGVPNATGKLGPPLERIARRAYLGGVLPNTPGNLALWIRVPQEFEPGSAMPNLGVSEADARDIAAYLYGQ